MPQLVKGGKHTFGWSRVGDRGRIIIPPEARDWREVIPEYVKDYVSLNAFM